LLDRSGARPCGTDRANIRWLPQRRLAGRARCWLSLAIALMLSGCFSAFEETQGRHSGATGAAAERHAGAGEYKVVGGDTLYSIAFRNQLDFHDLASWNRIGAPEYRIYPGRILRLTPPGSQSSASGKPVAPKAVAASQAELDMPAPAIPGPTPPPRMGMTAPRAEVAVPPDSAPPPRLPKPPATIAAANPVPRLDAGRWQWPTQGRVARGFGADGSKGIDIAGSLGQIVVAASAGKVVYSGSALKGYGELVILKHDEQYLSAYGFNQRRLVNEGEQVSAGQPIAELGYGPEQKPELHFEIRERGRPIDPLAQLPKR